MLDFVIRFHRYDDFSLNVSFFKIPKSVSRLTERIAPIDHRRDLASFKQLFHEDQILLVWA